jgi:hypothetical protein
MAEIPSGTKFIGIDASIPTPELNGTRVNNKTQHYTVEDIASFVGVGSEGPQGVQGPAGPPGPVGPAGLEWKGAWNTNSSYAVDDAVGFNGASWFCISAVTGTGNSNPEEDTESWALLAAQGATGPQGAQGPQGPQGPAGVALTKTYGTLDGSTGDPVDLIYDINRLIDGSGPFNQFKLPNTSLIGKEIVVYFFGTKTTTVYPSSGSNRFIVGAASLTSNIKLYSNDYYKFTCIGSNLWLVEKMEFTKKEFKAFITQTGTNNPVIDTTSVNTTEKTFTITRVNTGEYEITPNTPFSNFKKVFVNLEIQSGTRSIVVANSKITVYTFDDGVPFDLIDYSYLSIEIYT